MSGNLRTVDWNSMGYPQVPELLDQLVADDAQVQRNAAERLEDEVVLGGVNRQDYEIGVFMPDVLRNDAQVLLVPSLLKLLAPDSRSIKLDILYLLSQMLFYSHMIDTEDVYSQRAEKVRSAIWEGRHLCLDLLSNQHIRVRRAALTILAEFTEESRIVEARTLIAQRFEPILPPDTDRNIIA